MQPFGVLVRVVIVMKASVNIRAETISGWFM